MNDDRDNSKIQSSSEGSSTEVNASSEEKDTLASEQSIEPDKEVNSSSEDQYTLASEQSIEPDKEDPTKKDSSVKGWLLLLVLLITLGTGFYFYSYKEDSSFFTTLPDSLVKLFSTAPQLKNIPGIQSKEILARPPEEVIKKTEEATSSDTQSKELPAKFSGEIVKQTKRTNLFDKTTNENEKTIDLLRDEIQFLKAKLKQKSSPSQNFQIKRPHISGSFLEEKPEKITQQERKKPASTITTSPATPSPAKGEPLNQQSHLQKKSPQKRSEEVQAYLDFVESTGKKLIELIEKGWTHLQALVMKYRKNKSEDTESIF